MSELGTLGVSFSALMFLNLGCYACVEISLKSFPLGNTVIPSSAMLELETQIQMQTSSLIPLFCYTSVFGASLAYYVLIIYNPVRFFLTLIFSSLHQCMPKKSGTPRRKDVYFVSPSGEEIKSKRKLEQYLKSHPGGHSISEFDWSTGFLLCETCVCFVLHKRPLSREIWCNISEQVELQGALLD